MTKNYFLLLFSRAHLQSNSQTLTSPRLKGHRWYPCGVSSWAWWPTGPLLWRQPFRGGAPSLRRPRVSLPWILTASRSTSSHMVSLGNPASRHVIPKVNSSDLSWRKKGWNIFVWRRKSKMNIGRLTWPQINRPSDQSSKYCHNTRWKRTKNVCNMCIKEGFSFSLNCILFSAHMVAFPSWLSVAPNNV